MKKLLENVLVWLLEVSATRVVKFFDLDKDGKVSKREITKKLGPSTKLLLKRLK